MKKAMIQTSAYAAIALGAVSLITLACGCSTAKLPDYHPGATAATERTRRDAGVEIALDPFVERQRTDQFFGIDAAHDGIGIVFVRIFNNTPDHVFLVEKKDFQLLLAGASSGQNAGAQKVERGTAGGEATAMVGAAVSGLGGLALVLAGNSMVSHATEVRRNFVGKEMPDQTLPPGQNMEGFIYFQPVPKDAGWARGATLRINLTDTKSHGPVSMAIPLSQ